MAETAELFNPQPEEEVTDSVPGMLCLLAQVATRHRNDVSEYAIASLKEIIERGRALEALWSATKAGWPSGYSPEFTAAVQRLKKLEQAPGRIIEPDVPHAANGPQNREVE